MVRVLITGVAGFLGSRFAKWLLHNSPRPEVVGIDDLSTGFRENVPVGVHFFEMRCEDAARVFSKNYFDYVIHCAAYAAECLSPFARRFTYSNNIVATAALINECIRGNVRRLVFTSSAAVYGRCSPPCGERDVPQPRDPYGVAKLACELDLQIAREQHGLDFCVLRPHNIFGAGQNIWDPYRNVLGIWMRQLRESRPLTIFGDGQQRRAFTVVENCLEPIWNAAVRPACSGRTINLGSDEPRTVNEAADALLAVAGYGRKDYVESRHEAPDVHCRHELARQLLSYEDRVSFEDGLRDMWEWAKNQPERPVQPGPPIELDKGLYPSWRR